MLVNHLVVLNLQTRISTSFIPCLPCYLIAERYHFSLAYSSIRFLFIFESIVKLFFTPFQIINLTRIFPFHIKNESVSNQWLAVKLAFSFSKILFQSHFIHSLSLLNLWLFISFNLFLFTIHLYHLRMFKTYDTNIIWKTVDCPNSLESTLFISYSFNSAFWERMETFLCF